jgi:hypothetical protein
MLFAGNKYLLLKRITVQLYSLAETLPHPPAFGLIYEGAIGQPRQTTSLCDPLVHVTSKQPYFNVTSEDTLSCLFLQMEKSDLSIWRNVMIVLQVMARNNTSRKSNQKINYLR